MSKDVILKGMEQEIEEVWETIKEFKPEELKVVDVVNERELPFTYFNSEGTGNMKDMLYDLYYTVHLSGTEPAVLVTPKEQITILD